MARSLAERARPCQHGEDARPAHAVTPSAIPTSVPGAPVRRETSVVARVRAAVGAALDGHARVVLAVSGGRDSVVLLDAALAVMPECVQLVATFDHGTGPVARQAVRHVRALARAAGVPVRVGRGTPCDGTEAAWRTARWWFLRRAARAAGDGAGAPAIIATGHTAADQLETVVMRLLRGAGARGLAAMYAPVPGTVRPLLDVPAADVAAYAAARRLAWVDDPSNASRRHLRNRVRHELLPALLGVRPTLGAELLALARAAAACRRDLDAAAVHLATGATIHGRDAHAWVDAGQPVATLADLAGYDAPTVTALWPAMAARAGVRLDRRGTARLTAFTMASVAALDGGGVPSGSATVAGGRRVAVARRGSAGSPAWVMVVRRSSHDPVDRLVASDVALGANALARGVRFGTWRFRALQRVPTPAELEEGRVAWLAADRPYMVRAWRPGDRWRASSDATARRVKRFLADRRVPATARAGWPVVLATTPDVGVSAAGGGAGGEIVWVPGVRRSRAAPDRPGQPGFYLLCEPTPERLPG